VEKYARFGVRWSGTAFFSEGRYACLTAAVKRWRR